MGSPAAATANELSVLGALVAPLPPRRFLQEHWPERVYHAHGPRSRLPAIFSSPQLASFRALVAGYQGWLGFGRGSHGSRMISVQQVNPAHLYEIGLSIYLPDLAPCVPGTDAFLHRLESELGVAPGCARMTVWASPQGDGAPVHFDGEDVFSIQLAGTKRWEIAPMREYTCPVGPQYGPGGPVHDDMYAQLEGGFPDVDAAEFTAYDMKPGSVLFVPRGTWHRTSADQDSFAISIGFNPPSLADTFVEQLRHVLLQDPEWRRPLYGARGDHAQMENALARANRVLGTAPRALGAISARNLVPHHDNERLQGIDRDSRFQRDAGTRMVFERGRGAGLDMAEVRVWNREASEERVTLKLSVPPEYAAVFGWLSEAKGSFSAAGLAERFPEMPFDQVRKLLDVLTRGKYLRLLWFPQLPKA